MDKKKVLIIDDDARNIFALTATLRARRFECISCSSAAEALDLLQSDVAVDAILMDMMMPEMDGYEAIPRIRQIEKRKDTLVLAVTAQAMIGDREKCLQAGMNDYVSKPVDFPSLFRAIGKWSKTKKEATP